MRLTALGHAATIRHVFELVLRLKQICNFDPATGASTKLERLEADLEEIADSGRKAIVFSQWVGTLKRLADQLERFGPLEYHGQVPQRRRDAVIERFRDDPTRHLLLMSYGAGGVGLEPPVRQLRLPLRPLVEPGRRGPGDQSGPSHRRRRPGQRHAIPHARHDRRADRPHSAREARAVRHHLLRRRRPPQARANARRALRPLPTEMPLRPDRPGGVKIRHTHAALNTSTTSPGHLENRVSVVQNSATPAKIAVAA